MTDKLEQVKKFLYKKNFKKALLLLTKINKASSAQTFTTLDWQALCLFEDKKWLFAHNTWQKALVLAADKNQKIDVLWKIAQSAEFQGDLQEAQNSLMQSIALDDSITNINARMKLCEICSKKGDYETLEIYADKLLSYQASFFPALLLLINSAVKSFNKPLALKRLKKMAKEKNNLIDSQVTFITHHYITLNEYDEAHEFLNTFSNQYQSTLWFSLLNAIISLERKEYSEVLRLLESRDVAELPAWFGEDELFFVTLGKAYDKLTLYPQSFACFEQMGGNLSIKHKNFKKINMVHAYKNIRLTELPTTQYQCLQQQPVFMLGFPRSGTTLLETMLDTNPNTRTLSEPNTISAVAEKICQHFQTDNYVKVLTKLSPLQINELREYYFQCVEKYTGKSSQHNCIIDKMPLYSIYLPLIKILFPQAKLILSLRHPLDVILSNFQQNYTINNEMAYFINIESCVDRYIQVFDFIERVEGEIDLDMIVVKYEALLNDADCESARLFKFLGLPISNVGDFYLHAQQKVINTPSNNQVTKPLYISSQYKWKNYQPQLAEFIPRLTKYIKKYNY